MYVFIYVLYLRFTCISHVSHIMNVGFSHILGPKGYFYYTVFSQFKHQTLPLKRTVSTKYVYLALQTGFVLTVQFYTKCEVRK